MRLKAIICEVFTLEMHHAASRSTNCVNVEPLSMGLHDLGASMRSHLQERVDASDQSGYDAILLGYALCGRGTDGLRAGATPLVLPRAHDCIGVLMGSRGRHMAYFENHPGVYYRSPGRIKYQQRGQRLEPALLSANHAIGERRSREELIAQYGEDNGNFLYQQFTAYRRTYSGLTYIWTGVGAEDGYRAEACAEAEREHWGFEEVTGTTRLLEQMVNGDWNKEDFLVVPPGACVRATLGDEIMAAE